MHARTVIEQDEHYGSLAERVVLALAARLRRGSLILHLPDGRTRLFTGEEAGPQGEMSLRHPRVFRRLLAGGDIALAESYIDGEWESPDLTALIALGAANEEILGRTLAGNAWARLLSRLFHAFRPNSRRGSRRNIAAHYDLGNDFYAAWLDPGMTYSAALFDSPADDDLAAAQDRKYRRMAELAGIVPAHHVLEIGCGWGGFCTWAAREIGCRVTAITISREQYDFTQARLRKEGLEDRVELRLQDYRDLTETFDAVVSIEMLEAVGEAYWPTYFGQLHDRLKPGGKAALQVITVADERFERYRRHIDFIQRYIFPGGMLPSPGKLATLTATARFDLSRVERHGDDYARTLALWRRSFESAWPQIAEQSGGGFDARFRRLWRYYLAYCEAGFQAGRIDLLHLGLQRGGDT
ncbi:SAM-dependent methyltransferase [Pelagibius marinus]|uniref:SAM-dependent methyltransferase n=1 Tax=Pelagibius marinus TaxID=2762760 RepID=UPI0018722D08|nr:cyclopropane-fatty-acyl-phospholipid synthase family protein [Pelagibius marinus]